MKPRLPRRFLAAFLGLTAAATAWAAIPPVENLLPADALFVLAAPDCAALRAAGHQSPQWLFWSDPAMKPFRDKFTAKWDEEFDAYRDGKRDQPPDVPMYAANSEARWLIDFVLNMK